VTAQARSSANQLSNNLQTKFLAETPRKEAFQQPQGVSLADLARGLSARPGRAKASRVPGTTNDTITRLLRNPKKLGL
jgi:hypothetical protein